MSITRLILPAIGSPASPSRGTHQPCWPNTLPAASDGEIDARAVAVPSGVRMWTQSPAAMLRAAASSAAISISGPRDVARERLAVFRDAGVGTLMVSPWAWTFEERREQLRLVAELAA